MRTLSLILQSFLLSTTVIVCVCVCVCSACVCLFFHIILFGKTVFYMCIEYHI